MRTTLEIDEAVYKRAKAVAAETGRTLREVVEDALRQSFARRDAGRRPPVDLPTVRGTGPLPGLDFDRISALIEEIEGPFARP